MGFVYVSLGEGLNNAQIMHELGTDIHLELPDIVIIS